MKSPLETPLDEIRRSCLILFKDSIGFEFRVKATPLTDIIEDVDFLNQMVIGRKYGSFHIDLCELTGTFKKSLEQ